MNSDTKIDELDIKILKALLRNSRKSFSKIADECGVTTATINNRFNEMKKTGIIQGSTILVDLTHFGVECDGSLLVNINPKMMKEFLKDTRETATDFFVWPHKLNEKFNVSIWSPIKNITEMEKLKRSIKQHSAVIDVKENIWTYMRVFPDNLSLEESKR